MAQLPTSQQVPQHVTAQLSHLTSRPGVQSTLILSRQNGSIIQATGQLSPSSTAPTPASENPSQAAPNAGPEPTSSASLESQQPDLSVSTSSKARDTSHKPSQAETLAAQIFALVSSASALGSSISAPVASGNNEDDYGGSKIESSAGQNGEVKEEQKDDRNGHEREDDDELKLLRLRTKIHEVIIIPDRRFLLCVVHDVTGTSSSSGGR